MQTKFDIKPNTYIYIVLLLFLVPLKWLFAWVFAAGFHEICHWLAVRLCGGEIYSIMIGIGGAKMECGPMTKKKRLLAVLFGPLGGLLLVLFARWIPRVALCSWFLSLYNLLPLLQLDGGRALEILFGEKALVLQKIFLIVLSIVAIYVSVILRLGLLPLGIIAALWLKSRNFPCKPGGCKVQ
ncbi:MAG: hypothetical protein IKY18_08645 [Oscillospiraceae bacterium]|nr:hypothetical protein [Oscillospiraceae bacterium]